MCRCPVPTGQLLRLNMMGYGLSCEFPGMALANLRELQQLYLGDNALRVRSRVFKSNLTRSSMMPYSAACLLVIHRMFRAQGGIADVAKSLHTASLAEVPGARWTTAAGSSPSVLCGTPISAQSVTAGWA